VLLEFRPSAGAATGERLRDGSETSAAGSSRTDPFRRRAHRIDAARTASPQFTARFVRFVASRSRAPLRLPTVRSNAAAHAICGGLQAIRRTAMYARNNAIRMLGAVLGVAATLAVLMAIDGYARQTSEIATRRAQIVRLEPVTVIGERPAAGSATAAAMQGASAKAL
jgi:hypothetical protein